MVVAIEKRASADRRRTCADQIRKLGGTLMERDPAAATGSPRRRLGSGWASKGGIASAGEGSIRGRGCVLGGVLLGRFCGYRAREQCSRTNPNKR